MQFRAPFQTYGVRVCLWAQAIGSACVLNHEHRRPRVPQPSVRSSSKGGQGALCIRGRGWWAVGGPSTHGDKQWRGKEGKKPGLSAWNSSSVSTQGCCCSAAQELVWCRSILQGSTSPAVACACFFRVWSLFFFLILHFNFIDNLKKKITIIRITWNSEHLHAACLLPMRMLCGQKSCTSLKRGKCWESQFINPMGKVLHSKESAPLQSVYTPLVSRSPHSMYQLAKIH